MGPSGVLKDVLLDVPRPILSLDEPPFVPAEERPVPRNMNISQDILKKFGYTPGCAKCSKLSGNEYSHPGLAHSQACRTRIEAASRQTLCILTVLSVQDNERLTSTERQWNKLITQDESHWNRVLCLNRQLKKPKVKTNRVFGIPSQLVCNQNKTCPVKSLIQCT